MPDFGIMRGFNEKLFGDKLVAGQLPTQLGLIGSQDIGSLLLDFYPNAAAAYSLRKLRNLYTGSAIRVRRTDLTETDIGFTAAGDLDTTALLAFTGMGALDNGFVTTWYDQSGNAKNSIQTTALNQPQIVSAGSVIFENGKPCLSFDGVNDKMISTITYNINSIYIQKVERWRTNTAGQISTTFDANQGPYLQWIQNNNVFENYVYGTNASSTASTLRKLFSFYSTLGFFENGSSKFNITTTQNISVNNINIGGYTSGLNAAVNIQEFVFYTASQISNRTGIDTNINTYYAIY